MIRALFKSRLAWEDLFHRRRPFLGVDRHLATTAEWMIISMDAAGGNGVADYFTVGGGWGPANLETAANAIPTFFALADRLGRSDIAERALRLAQGVAAERGGGNSYLNIPAEGQKIRGLVAAWQRAPDARLLESAVWAAERLCSVQSSDGSWRGRADDVLTAFSLYRLGRKAHRPEFCERAFRQYEWTLVHQLRNGFVRNTDSEAESSTLTHNLGNALEGLYRFSKDADDNRGVDACQRLMVTLEGMYGGDDRLPGRLDRELESTVSWSCVTGNVQLGWLALRVGKITDDRALSKWGKRLIQAAAATQAPESATPGIRGGVFGSTPVYGSYYPLRTVNWGAKYLLDALLELKG